MHSFINTAISALAITGMLSAAVPAQADNAGAVIAGGIIGLAAGVAIASGQHTPYYDGYGYGYGQRPVQYRRPAYGYYNGPPLPQAYGYQHPNRPWCFEFVGMQSDGGRVWHHRPLAPYENFSEGCRQFPRM